MIRVMVVEDSLLFRAMMTRMLQADETLAVSGGCGSIREAREALAQEKPDVVTLDLNLKDGLGLELLEWMREACPEVPVLVVTSVPSACEQALQAGARDFIEKPQEAASESRERFALLLRLKVKTLAMDVFHPVAAMPEKTAETPARTATAVPRRPRESVPLRSAPAPAEPPDTPEEPQRSIIVLGASLGGTEATLAVLRELPADMPGILVVQHMPQGFTKAYAMRLDSCCMLSCREARSGDLVTRGTVLVAPGGSQMTVQRVDSGYRVRCVPEEKVPGRFCPSVDVLFHSAALGCGADAVGVILTGMGRDGAAGMKEMHDAGAFTLGQDEKTCAVYGMPQAAKALGAVDVELPLSQIAGELVKSIRRK